MGGNSISFVKYMKYIYAIQKPDDDIVSAHAQQIETGNFEGRVLNLRNGFITDAGCERLCQALRKQIADSIKDEKTGTSVKHLYLSNNPLGDASSVHLADLLNTPGCEIHHLALGMDLMSDVGYKNIGDVLGSNKTIQYLELDHIGRIYRELKDRHGERVFEFMISASTEKRIRTGWLCCAQQGRHSRYRNP
jgi:hypothetical protein